MPEPTKLSSEMMEEKPVSQELDGMEPEKNGEDAPSAAEEKTEKLLQVPFARVKHIMKMDPDLTVMKADAVFAISKAVELFVESLAVECYSYTERAGKKIVSKADFDKAIAGADCLAFLEGALED